MSFLKKKKMSHRPEPAEELFARVHVGEGEPQYDRVFELPASHLTRSRLAPLVAMAEDLHQGGGGGYVIRIQCRLSDFAQAVALTAVEEAAEGRTSCGRVVAPSAADVQVHHLQAWEAMMRWLLDPASCDPSILEKALTGDSADLRAAAEVISSRTPSQLQILRNKCKRTSSPEAVPTRGRKTSKAKSATKSLAARISERLRGHTQAVTADDSTAMRHHLPTYLGTEPQEDVSPKQPAATGELKIQARSHQKLINETTLFRIGWEGRRLS